ncbi:hypothetical protein A0H81_02220 [Grifola frondosa]|uniref:Uncharacterized protein n=1 Tax=Grifola frondosa TaxID=5627 RepID=A0A1C7MN15_GRIFR|nr:hypothetical protein A0H81_02220 [Grifola frondosa]
MEIMDLSQAGTHWRSNKDDIHFCEENEDKAMEEALAGQVDRYCTMEEHSEAAKRWMSSAPWSIAAVNPIVQLRYPPRRRQPHIEGLRARAQAKIGALGVIQYSSLPSLFILPPINST